ncbi:MAG: helix-turn-helix domain-containing protein, partial [Chloroflexota bacterium]|nr:helix-turn-helix domain-containing protein [Chloroflexota bacterium]
MTDPVRSASFAMLLRQYRLAAGLTQAALAERAGLAERTIQDLERGVGRPRRETFHRLTAALHLAPDARAEFERSTSSPRHRRGRRAEGILPSGNSSPGSPDAPGLASAARMNMPTPLASFVGRERELADLVLLIETCRLLTLTGPGGCGKTRLAQAFAPRVSSKFPDGVYFVSLAPLADPSLVASTVAEALGIPETPDRPVTESLRHGIGERRILLMLDNFEHLLAAGPWLVDLLAACAHLAALVTSREVLRLRGEQVYPVPSLSLPDPEALSPGDAGLASSLSETEAVRLFVDRARSARPDFRLDAGNAAAVAEVCLRLDGLPLALELAAAHVRHLAPQAMRRRLESRLRLLTGGARDLPARQRTLRDTIAWSYDLLDDAERRLFRRLSVFVGEWSLEAAEVVCEASGDLGLDVLDGVVSLADKSLLRHGATRDAEPRFAMLETIREYGLEQLGAAGEEAGIRRRHLAWYADLAERGQTGMHGPDGADWTRRLAAEVDNFRAALAWSLADADPSSAHVGLRMAGALFQYWLFRDHVVEGRRWLESTLAADHARAADGTTPTPLPAPRVGAFGAHPRVVALGELSVLTTYMGDMEQSSRLAEEALSLARRVQDRLGEAHA